MLKLVKNFLILNLGLAAFTELMNWQCNQYFLKYFMLDSLGLLLLLMLVHVLRPLGKRKAHNLLMGLAGLSLCTMLVYGRMQVGVLSTDRLEFLIISFLAHAIPFLVTGLIYLSYNHSGARLLALLLAALGITSVLYGALLGNYPGWVDTGGRFIFSAGIFIIMSLVMIPLAWLRLPQWTRMLQTHPLNEEG